MWGWTIEGALKDFQVVTFELKELTEKNKTTTEIIKDLIKDGKINESNT